MSAVIPGSYEQWRFCIEVDCGIALRPEFIRARLQTLSDPASAEAQRFASMYGKDHLDRVVGWFARAQLSAQGA